MLRPSLMISLPNTFKRNSPEESLPYDSIRYFIYEKNLECYFMKN